MAEPTKDLEALQKEQEVEDREVLAELDNLDKESKEFDKDAEIERIRGAFRANAYDVLGLQPGVPAEDIKKTYRKKSLLIHPDKSKNANAPDAFDRLAIAHQTLLDEKKREDLDEAIAAARRLVMRERKLTTDDEEVKNPDTSFMKDWKEKIKYVLLEDEMRRQRKMKAQMQEEGRQQRMEDEATAERKRKRDFEQNWENTREERIGNWREFVKSKDAAKSGSKKKKIKTLG